MSKFNLNELTLDNVGAWPMPIKIALVSIMAVFLIGIGYWVLVQPNVDTLDSAVQQETTLKAQFETKAYQAENLDAYKNQLNIMEEKFGAMLRTLPAQNEMPALLEEISQTGIESGLKFELFAPQKEEVHDFYIDMPIKIKVVGRYKQLAIFLSRVVEMTRIVTLHDFSIGKMEEPGKKNLKDQDNSSNRLLEMEITVRIYRYKTL